MARRRSADGELSLRFIVHWEERVAKQKRLIAELKSKRRPTLQAEAALKAYSETLDKLRNHAELMSALMSPDPFSWEIGGTGRDTLQLQTLANLAQGSQARRTS
jgi:hypothetical protein